MVAIVQIKRPINRKFTFRCNFMAYGLYLGLF